MWIDSVLKKEIVIAYTSEVQGREAWRDGAAVKTCSSCRGLQFGSQNYMAAHSCLYATIAPENPTPLSGLHRIRACTGFTNIHAVLTALLVSFLLLSAGRIFLYLWMSGIWLWQRWPCWPPWNSGCGEGAGKRYRGTWCCTRPAAVWLPFNTLANWANTPDSKSGRWKGNACTDRLLSIQNHSPGSSSPESTMGCYPQNKLLHSVATQRCCFHLCLFSSVQGHCICEAIC